MDDDRSTNSREADDRLTNNGRTNNGLGTGAPAPDVIVVGAGIAGLASAITARSLGAQVTVLDAHPGGGRARTDERDGFLHNLGPHALYRAGHLQRLLDQHGLHVPGSVPDASRIDLCRDGRVHPLELSATGITRASLFGRRSRLRLLTLFATLPRRRTAPLVGTTVADWLADEPADVAAVVQGLIRVSTYGHAPDQLDAGVAVAQLQLAFKGVRYLDGGWTRIIEAMTKRARSLGAVVRTDTSVLGVESGPDRATVHTADGSIEARSVIVAAGGPDLAGRLIGNQVSGLDRMTAPVTASSLDLATTRWPTHLHLGLDEPLYLSPHAPIAALAPSGKGLVSVLRYLTPGEPAGDPAERRAELRAFAMMAGISDADIVHDRYLHQSVVSYGLPSASGGGLAGRPAVDATGLPGVYFAGDWVGPAGLLADASAASGEAAGRLAAARCAKLVA